MGDLLAKAKRTSLAKGRQGSGKRTGLQERNVQVFILSFPDLLSVAPCVWLPFDCFLDRGWLFHGGSGKGITNR